MDDKLSEPAKGNGVGSDFEVKHSSQASHAQPSHEASDRVPVPHESGPADGKAARNSTASLRRSYVFPDLRSASREQSHHSNSTRHSLVTAREVQPITSPVEVRETVAERGLDDGRAAYNASKAIFGMLISANHSFQQQHTATQALVEESQSEQAGFVLESRPKQQAHPSSRRQAGLSGNSVNTMPNKAPDTPPPTLPHYSSQSTLGPGDAPLQDVTPVSVHGQADRDKLQQLWDHEAGIAASRGGRQTDPVTGSIPVEEQLHLHAVQTQGHRKQSHDERTGLSIADPFIMTARHRNSEYISHDKGKEKENISAATGKASRFPWTEIDQQSIAMFAASEQGRQQEWLKEHLSMPLTSEHLRDRVGQGSMSSGTLASINARRAMEHNIKGFKEPLKNPSHRASDDAHQGAGKAKDKRQFAYTQPNMDAGSPPSTTKGAPGKNRVDPTPPEHGRSSSKYHAHVEGEPATTVVRQHNDQAELSRGRKVVLYEPMKQDRSTQPGPAVRLDARPPVLQASPEQRAYIHAKNPTTPVKPRGQSMNVHPLEGAAGTHPDRVVPLHIVRRKPDTPPPQQGSTQLFERADSPDETMHSPGLRESVILNWDRAPENLERCVGSLYNPRVLAEREDALLRAVYAQGPHVKPVGGLPPAPTHQAAYGYGRTDGADKDKQKPWYVEIAAEHDIILEPAAKDSGTQTDSTDSHSFTMKGLVRALRRAFPHDSPEALVNRFRPCVSPDPPTGSRVGTAVEPGLPMSNPQPRLNPAPHPGASGVGPPPSSKDVRYLIYLSTHLDNQTKYREEAEHGMKTEQHARQYWEKEAERHRALAEALADERKRIEGERDGLLATVHSLRGSLDLFMQRDAQHGATHLMGGPGPTVTGSGHHDHHHRHADPSTSGPSRRPAPAAPAAAPQALTRADPATQTDGAAALHVELRELRKLRAETENWLVVLQSTVNGNQAMQEEIERLKEESATWRERCTLWEQQLTRVMPDAMYWFDGTA